MNSNSKLELHPDAESLNAFAEQALPERERGEIVAHLAKCGRCREVVFLAQEAAVEAEPEYGLAVAAAAAPAFAAAPASEAAPQRESWFKSWRVAWVPIGALAVGLSAAYLVHVRHEEIAVEQARVAREAAAHNVEMAATVPASPMSGKAVPPATETVPPGQKKLKPELPGIAAKEMTPVAAPLPLSESRAMVASSSAYAGRRAEEFGAGVPAMDVAAGSKPEPVPAAKRKEQESAGDALQARGMGTDKSPQVGAVEQGKKDEFQGVVAAAAPMAQVEANSAYSASAEVSGRTISGQSRKIGASALYKAKTAPLPSGMIPVSRETTQGRTVAVDAAGGVFLSEDAGGHWGSVAKQWGGRAVSVRLQAKVGSSAGTADVVAGGFEIVNDQGRVWVSTDGRVWKAK